jgi:acyl-CoA hydrolase
MSSPPPRHPDESTVQMTELILPQHTNALGTCFGGQILSWIDIAAGICAGRHARCTAVTVAFDDVHFVTPIRLGDVVTICARITLVGRSSMEVWVDVQRGRYDGESEHANTAYVTFVAVDADRRPREVPGLVLDNEADRLRHAQALDRRAIRLARARQS